MRPFLIEFADESIEARLLLQEGPAGRPCGLLLQRQVHALMTSVLLRVARPDALEANTQPQPPDRQLREVVEPVRAGEGQSIVGTDRARQTMLGKDTPEGLEDTLLARRFEGLAA